jgi:phosphoglycolate phosphatase-like HAD superfamily hydrolase
MPLDLSRIRAVCFDIDGTLSDTDDQMIAHALPWLFPLRRFFATEFLTIISRRLVFAGE